MFPPNNLEPGSQNWVREVERVLTDVESKQPGQDTSLNMLQRAGTSVIDDVSSNINAYYTATMAQYPMFHFAIPMQKVLGGDTKVVAISAPAAADNTVAENWVEIFSTTVSLPVAKTVLGVRLNAAQMRLQGSATYDLKFRWVAGTTMTEGINTTRWMSRHEFNLEPFNLDPTTPVPVNVTNRYAHWTGASTSSIAVRLQACIENPASRASAVASQNITFHGVDSNGLDTYLDLMVTI